MQGTRRTGTIAVVVAALLAPAGLHAQSTTASVDPALSARAEALAEIDSNRSLVIRETVDRWRSQFRPFVPWQNTGGEEGQLTAALQTASAEKLLAASQAQTYEEVLTALSGRWQGPSVIPLEPGQIPNTLGSSTSDLVYTPVTPCRIIDTRFATDPTKLGRIGPSAGKQFSVSLANYATQGGFAGSCGIPIAPAAVAINVTSTDQTGPGNLSAIQTGGGIPNSSLLNYNPGVNLANSAVVRSAGTLGGDNIFIYSGNSASQVVVDILGYFAAPVVTAVENNVLFTTTNVLAGAIFDIFSPVCPAGWRLTGGGCLSNSYAGPACIGSRPVDGLSTGLVTGVNLADRWLCQGTNGGGAQNYHCFSVCARVPGR